MRICCAGNELNVKHRIFKSPLKMQNTIAPVERVVTQKTASNFRRNSREHMKKKRICSAPRCQAAAGPGVWIFRPALILLLLCLPSTSCNDAAKCTEDNLWCQLLRGISNPPDKASPSPCNGFRCGSSECVEFNKICDNVSNCADGSDENPAACINRTCNLMLDIGDLTHLGSGLVRLDSVVRAWRCDNGECIGDVYRCDGHRNCEDASDETPLACFDRSCTPAQFTCKTGQCIRTTDLCNGRKDCFDGSDEDRSMCYTYLRSRPRTICPARVLNYCADRTQCYHKRQHCDGEVNCFDGSDEDPKTCGYNEAPAPTPPITVPPPTPAPPITTPLAQVEPIPPSTVEFPDTENGAPTRCDPSSCPCPLPGMEHVCLPCLELANITDTCLQLQRGAHVCSVEIFHASITVDILSCGGQGLQNDFSIFERNSPGCRTADKKVPVLTVVMADCWRSSTLALRCYSDGTWGEYGVITSATERMRHICQPRDFNSPLCGRKPRYRKTSDTLHLRDFHVIRNLHPWLLGLKKRERYECSATLITSEWLITAAHCVVRSQESHNETIDPRDLRVQLTSQRHSDQFVSEVVLHPQYTPGSLLNDIALIRIESPLRFNERRYPACVDFDGEGFLTSPFAMAFSRPNGEVVYNYKTVLQQVDPACHSPVSRCRSLLIEHSQFCGLDLEREDHLVGGSSGGPFMQNLGSDHDESWAVSGVVSFSVENPSCGDSFTVYTAVHICKEWIQNVIHRGPLF